MDQETKFVIDVQGLPQLAAYATALQALNRTIASVDKVTRNLSEDGDLLRETFTGLTNAGDRYVAVTRTLADGTQATTVALKTLSDTSDRLARRLEALNRLRRSMIMGKAAQAGAALGFTPEEIQKATPLLNQLANKVNELNMPLNEVQKRFDEISNGAIPRYGNQIDRLIYKMINLKKASKSDSDAALLAKKEPLVDHVSKSIAQLGLSNDQILKVSASFLTFKNKALNAKVTVDQLKDSINHIATGAAPRLGNALDIALAKIRAKLNEINNPKAKKNTGPNLVDQAAKGVIFDALASQFAGMSVEDQRFIKSRLRAIAAFIKNDKVTPKEMQDAINKLIAGVVPDLKNPLEAAIHTYLQSLKKLPSRVKAELAKINAIKMSALNDRLLGNIDFGGMSPEKGARVRSAIQAVVVAALKAKVTMTELDTAMNNVLSGRPADASNALENKIRSLKDALSSANVKSQNFLITWQSIARVVEVQILQAMFYRITGDITAATNSAAEFQTKLSEIRTISQDAQLSTEQWLTSLRAVSDKSGLPLLEVTAAGYEAISNQIVKGADAFAFLSDAADLARVSVTGIDVAANTLATVINAYGMTANDAQKISAMLFQTVDLGRITLNELEQALATAAPMAAELGVELKELNAVLSVLTIKGVRSDTAATGINNIMSKLLSPSKEMTLLLRQWGVGSGQAAIETFGFLEVLRKLDNELRTGGASRLGDLLPDVRGLRAAMAALGQGSLKDIQDFAGQAEAANKKYQNAIKITNESVARAFLKDMNAVANSLTVDAGQRILVFFDTVVKTFGGFELLAKSLNAVFSTVLSTTTALLTPVKAFASIMSILDSATGKISKNMGSFEDGVKSITNFAVTGGVFLATLGLLTSAFGTYTTATVTGTIATTGFSVAIAAVNAKLVALAAVMRANPIISALAIAAAAATYFYNLVAQNQERINGMRDKYIVDEQDRTNKLKKMQEDLAQKDLDTAVEANNAKAKSIRAAYTAMRLEINTQLKAISADFDAEGEDLTKKLEERIKETTEALATMSAEAAKKAYENALDPDNLTQRFGQTVSYLQTLRDKLSITKDFEQARTILKDMQGIAEEMSKALRESIRGSQNSLIDLGFEKQKNSIDAKKKSGSRDKSVTALIDEKQTQINQALNVGNIELARKFAEQINALVGMIDSEKLANKTRDALIDTQIRIEQANIALREQELRQAEATAAQTAAARVALETALKAQAESALELSLKFDKLVAEEEKLITAIKDNTEALKDAFGKEADARRKMIDSSVGLAGSGKTIDAALRDWVSLGGTDADKNVFKKFNEENAKLQEMVKRGADVADIARQTERVTAAFGQLKNIEGLPERFKDVFKQFEEDLFNMFQAIGEREAAGKPKFAKGGFVGGRMGGEVDVTAHAGEHITNPYASARFAPLLQAINSFDSSNPVPAAGDTFNTYVTYDPSKTPQHNVRDVTRAIRRELNRKSVRIG